jgi:hypothetical protein
LADIPKPVTDATRIGRRKEPCLALFSLRYSDGETIQLGGREFFFVGDNVGRSGDSRILGPSDRSALVGVVDLRYWPIGRVAILR